MGNFLGGRGSRIRQGMDARIISPVSFVVHRNLQRIRAVEIERSSIDQTGQRRVEIIALPLDLQVRRPVRGCIQEGQVRHRSQRQNSLTHRQRHCDIVEKDIDIVERDRMGSRKGEVGILRRIDGSASLNRRSVVDWIHRNGERPIGGVEAVTGQVGNRVVHHQGSVGILGQATHGDHSIFIDRNRGRFQSCRRSGIVPNEGKGQRIILAVEVAQRVVWTGQRRRDQRPDIHIQCGVLIHRHLKCMSGRHAVFIGTEIGQRAINTACIHPKQASIHRKAGDGVI